jgi:hypothetical protein
MLNSEKNLAFMTDKGQRVTVRYSQAVAKWVAERDDAQCEAPFLRELAVYSRYGTNFRDA